MSNNGTCLEYREFWSTHNIIRSVTREPARNLAELAIFKVVPALVEECEIEASATATKIHDTSNVLSQAMDDNLQNLLLS